MKLVNAAKDGIEILAIEIDNTIYYICNGEKRKFELTYKINPYNKNKLSKTEGNKKFYNEIYEYYKREFYNEILNSKEELCDD